MALHLLVLVFCNVHELSGTVQVNKVCEGATVYIKNLDEPQSVTEQTFLTTDVICVISGRHLRFYFSEMYSTDKVWMFLTIVYKSL